MTRARSGFVAGVVALLACVALLAACTALPPLEHRTTSAAPQLDAPSDGGPLGSSGSSLHSKTFSVDQASVFIGSFNFDPRSAKLNTEIGFVIESAQLAKAMDAVFETRIPGAAYEVRLSDAGAMYWTEQRNGVSLRHDTEPGTSFWRRAGVWLVSLLPIDWLL